MLYVLRHAQANGQEFEAELTEEGAKKANQIIRDLEKLSIKNIYSSPMRRAIDTIRPFAVQNDIQIITIDDLSERVLSDIAIEDWLTKLKLTFTSFDIKFNNGESSREAQRRAIKFIESLNSNENNLIVSHGNLIALIIKYYDETFGFNEWKALKNPDLFCIDENHIVKHMC